MSSADTTAAAAPRPVRYLCGCEGWTVGQSFSDGLLVCPRHHVGVAPYERPQAPARARFTLTLDLRAETSERLRTLTDWLQSEAFGLPETTALDSSFEELGG